MGERESEREAKEEGRSHSRTPNAPLLFLIFDLIYYYECRNIFRNRFLAVHLPVQGTFVHWLTIRVFKGRRVGVIAGEDVTARTSGVLSIAKYGVEIR